MPEIQDLGEFAYRPCFKENRPPVEEVRRFAAEHRGAWTWLGGDTGPGGTTVVPE